MIKVILQDNLYELPSFVELEELSGCIVDDMLYINDVDLQSRYDKTSKLFRAMIMYFVITLGSYPYVFGDECLLKDDIMTIKRAIDPTVRKRKLLYERGEIENSVKEMESLIIKILDLRMRYDEAEKQKAAVM